MSTSMARWRSAAMALVLAATAGVALGQAMSRQPLLPPLWGGTVITSCSTNPKDSEIVPISVSSPGGVVAQQLAICKSQAPTPSGVSVPPVLYIEANWAIGTSCDWQSFVGSDGVEPYATMTSTGCGIDIHTTRTDCDRDGTNCHTTRWTRAWSSGSSATKRCNSTTTGMRILDPSAGAAAECGCPEGSVFVEAVGRCAPVKDRAEPQACTPTMGNPVAPLSGTKSQSARLPIGPAFDGELRYDTLAMLADLQAGAGLSAEPLPAFGRLWAGAWHRSLRIINSPLRHIFDNRRSVLAERGHGRWISFIEEPDGTWRAEADVNDRLTRSGSGWLYRDSTALADEEYDANGRLLRIVSARGAITTFDYSTTDTPASVAPIPGLLMAVSDAQLRRLRYEYELGPGSRPRVVRVIAPSGAITTLGYSPAGALATITGPDQAVRRFLYEDARWPFALTGVVDESGRRVGSYTYDDAGRATATARGDGLDAHAVRWGKPPRRVVNDVYDAERKIVWREHAWEMPEDVVITQPDGQQRQMAATSVRGQPRLARQDQPAGSGCAAASATQRYDANGNLAELQNFNGHRSCLAHDPARNLETTRIDGLGPEPACSAVLAAATLPEGSRRTSRQWHPDWPLPTREAAPGRITDFVYHGQPDPFAGGAAASCMVGAMPMPGGGAMPVLCRQVERATLDPDGAKGLAATFDGAVAPREQRWTYDAQGRVLSHDGPRTDVADLSTYEYASTATADNAVGDLILVRNPLGHASRVLRHDGDGRVLETADANGVLTRIGYDAHGHLASRTVAAGTPQARTTTYQHHPDGRLLAVAWPAASALTAAGSAGNAQARTARYGYDGAGRLVSITTGSGEELRYELDANGNVQREELLNAPAQGGSAQLLRREFDALGRLWREIRLINGADAVTTYGHDANGNPSFVRRPRVAEYGEAAEPEERRAYDRLDRLARVEDALNGSARPLLLTPDPRGELQAVRTPNGATTTFERDGFGRVLAEHSPDRGTTRYTWDSADNLRTRTDARGLTTTWAYDALNRVLSATYRLSGSTDASDDEAYTWDAAPGAALACAHGVGRLCRVVDGSGTRHLAWDAFGNLAAQHQVELGLTTQHAFAHDGEDRLSAVTTAAGRVLAAERDAEGRVARLSAVVQGATGPQVLALAQDGQYRADGQLISQRLGNGTQVNRHYDDNGALLAAQVAAAATGGEGPGGGGTAVPTEGDVPLPAWALVLLGGAVAGALRRRSAGAALAVWLAVGVTALPERAHAQAQTANPEPRSEQLQHDARGNIRQRTVNGQVQTYGYDSLDRLRQSSGPEGANSYGLDANGNRTSDSRATYSVQSASNRLATRAGRALAYDAEGRLLEDQALLNGALVTRRYTWSPAGRLRSVSVNGVEVARYAYDARGLRTRKQLTNPRPGQPAVVLYRYDAEDRLLEEVAGSAASAPGINVVAGQSLVTHVWQGEVLVAQVLAAHSPGNEGHAAERVLWLHTDHLGTPRAASDEAGRVVWRWEGEAFGASLAQEDPDGDGQRTGVNVRFAGQYYDDESGLHYNGQRYYDGQSGRYVQSDPIGLQGGINTYAYVDGAPTMYTDPDGLQRVLPGPVPLLVPGPIPVRSSTRPIDPSEPGGATYRIGPSWPSWPPNDPPDDRSCPSSSPKDRCQQQYENDSIICRSLKTADAKRRCWESAIERRAACVKNGRIPPLSTWY